MGGNGYFWKVALIVWFLNSNRSTWVTLHDLSVFRQDLGQRAWVLLVEVLHGVDPGVVRDLLQPPHRPGNVIGNCANCFSWKFCFDGQLHLKWSTFKPPKRTCIVAIVQVHFWKGHIYWCVYTKSHQLIEKTCQQDRPSPSKDSGPPQLALPWPCTEDRAAPGETKLLKGSSTTWNLCLTESAGFTWSRSSDIFGPVMSVKLTDRPIPDEDYWFNEHFVQEDNAHPVSRSLQRWQIGRSKSEWRPEFFLNFFQSRTFSVESVKESKLSSY